MRINVKVLFIRFSFLLLVAFMLSSCFLGSISDFSEKDIRDNENEIYNCSFEQGEYGINNFPDGWFSLDSKEGEIVWENTVSQDGNKSIKINGKHDASIISEAFNINPAGVYYSRCFAKTKDNLALPVRISFIAFNKNGKKVGKFSRTTVVSDKWIPVNITTGFFNGSAVFGRLVITVKAQKDYPVWLDNVGNFKVYEIK
ncbi:MAG: hypothetical protein KAS49_06310 [Candidatus Cloacimonetes bacterium]|nr:hypothetical protein [Candidatus Cloacimonadota bacterium]